MKLKQRKLNETNENKKRKKLMKLKCKNSTFRVYFIDLV